MSGGSVKDRYRVNGRGGDEILATCGFPSSVCLSILDWLSHSPLGAAAFMRLGGVSRLSTKLAFATTLMRTPSRVRFGNSSPSIHSLNVSEVLLYIQFGMTGFELRQHAGAMTPARVGPTRCCSINLIHSIAQISSRRAVKKTAPAE